MKRFSWFLTPCAIFLAIGGTLLTTSGVQAAAPSSTPNHHIHLMPSRYQTQNQQLRPNVQPQVGGSGNLNWLGGPVQHSPHTYVIFWGSFWKTNTGALSHIGVVVDNYFKDMGGTSFENILTQYYDGSSHVNNSQSYGGYWIDTANPSHDSSCGGNTVEDSAIQAEVNHAIAVKGWQRDSANGTYYVYTPDGYYVNDGSGSCSEQVFCAYHGWSGSASVSYAAMAYPIDLNGCGVPSNPNGSAHGDALTNVTSHEQFESITDFKVNVSTAWVDNAGYEIGDKCAWDFSKGYTHLNNGGTFEIQTEYSNATRSCVNSR